MEITTNRAYAFIVGLMFIWKIYAAIFVGADGALFHTGYYALQNIPYSIVWTWLNPLWLGYFWYGVYVVIFDAITLIGYWHVKRIPKSYLAMIQVLSIYWYIGQGSEFQNVSIFALLPLMFFAFTRNGFSKVRLVLLSLIAPLVKAPLGWSWDLSDTHVQCVLKCSGMTLPQIPLMDKLTEFFSLYLILVCGWLFTVNHVRRMHNTLSKS